ncbi:MAG: c-type cytochrome [Acidobacteria bacterium]|nr:c-type cytochrome [Acidobacteriota bacterium]
MKRKTIAGLALAMLCLVAVFAVFSFWRENWSAKETPGRLEQFFAEMLLRGSRGTVTELPNPVPASEANLLEGRDLYEKQCAFCHGQDGTASGHSGVQFYPPVPSLAPPQNQLTDSQMQSVMERGIRYTAMPSFAKALNEDQRWKVVLWVRQLSRPGSDEKLPLPTEQTP